MDTSDGSPGDTSDTAAAEYTGLYRAEDGFIWTEDDHVLLLRGINLSGVAKNTEDYLYPLTVDEIDLLIAGGMNSVRLLTFWCAIAPEGPDAVDEEYIAAFTERVQMLTEAGLYVIIDMHQDLWGRPFNNHGAPQWACPAELTEGYESISPWYMNYVSSQVSACFDNFWDDPSLRGAMVDAWVAMAQAVCPFERVVGFDHINEPWPGTDLLNPDFDNESLAPFYQEVMTGIETVCPGRLHFLERGGGGVIGLAETLEIPEDMRPQSVYAPHFYPAEVHDPSDGGYDLDRAALEERIISEFGASLEDGVPVWIGEFGGLVSNPNFDRYIQDLHQIFLKHNILSALWDFTIDSDGFGYLEAAGQPKTVFDSVYRLPNFTLLPAAPEQITPDWDARSMTARFSCETAKRVEVLLPPDGCSCVATPPEAIDIPAPSDGMNVATCLTTEDVELSCTCPESTDP